MAKQKSKPKKKPRVLKPKVISIGPATAKKKPAKKTTKKKERKKMTDIALLPAAQKPSVLIPIHGWESHAPD